MICFWSGDPHILSNYVDLDLNFLSQKCTYVMYIHRYTPHPPQAAIYVLDSGLEISRYPPAHTPPPHDSSPTETYQ